MSECDTDDQRIDHKGDDQHGGYQHQDQFTIGGKDFQTACRNGVENKTQDTKRRAADYPADNLGCTLCQIFHILLDSGAGLLERDSEDNRPEQDTDVVCIYQCMHRIGNDTHEKIKHDLRHAAGSSITFRCIQACQCDLNRMDKIDHHRNDCRTECTEQIQENDRAELSHTASLCIGQGGGDQDEDQDRRDRLQRSDKEFAKYGNPGHPRHSQPQNGTDHKTDAYPHNKTQ